MNAFRTSPFEPVWRHAASRLGPQHGMNVPAECGGADVERERAAALGIADVSGLPRSIVKGRGAGALIEQSGFSPSGAWYEPSRRGPFEACARTGTAEFTVEGALARSAANDCAVYPRQEGSLLLAGHALADVLEELLPLALDFERPRLTPTLFARLPCSVLPRSTGALPALQLWVDATYAFYVGEVVARLASEVNGGWVGPAALEGLSELPPEVDLWRPSWT